MRKLFLFVLILTNLFTAAVHAEPEDGLLKKCGELIKDALPTLRTGSLKQDAEEKEYAKFLRIRRREHKAPPPTATEPWVNNSPEALADLIIGFKYWWFHDNVWHEIMMEEYGDLGRSTIVQQLARGFVPPTPEVIAEVQNNYPINIPYQLPNIDD